MAGTFAQARASAGTSAAWSMSSPRTMALSARAPQETPCRDRAPQLAVLTHRRDVADAEAPHAADGTVQEGLVRHGDDGARGDRRDPLVQDRGSAPAQSPQDVALGDDAERRHGRAGVADEQ